MEKVDSVMKELMGQSPRIFGLEPPLVVCCQSHLRRQQKIMHGQELYPFELANVAYCYSVNPKTIDNKSSLSVS